MRAIAMIGVLLLSVAGVAFAASWTGKLVDATCAAGDQNAACAPMASTTAFAIKADGKVLKLDAAGNEKATEALKNRADRAKNPDAPAQDTEVTATVNGTLEGDTVKVESISIQ